MKRGVPGRPAWWSVLAGAGLVALYLVTAGVSFRGGLLPAVPLLDGLGPPPPYQWVKPPPDRVKDNKPPSGITGTIPLTTNGSAGSVITPDGQASLILDCNSVTVLPGQTALKVSIDPLDPATIAPPPGGLVYDSNAYRIQATYQPSNQPVATITATIVLSYATNAKTIYAWNGQSWDALPSTVAGQNQLFAPVTKLGVFATAGTGNGQAVKQPSPLKAVIAVVGIFMLVAVILFLGLFWGRRRTQPRR